MNDVPFHSNFVPIFIKLSLRKIISFFRPDNPQLQEAFDTVYEVKIREKYQPQDIKIFLGFGVKKIHRQAFHTGVTRGIGWILNTGYYSKQNCLTILHSYHPKATQDR